MSAPELRRLGARALRTRILSGDTAGITYTAQGKQVLRDGKRFADACDTAAAELIANTLNLALDRCPPLVGA